MKMIEKENILSRTLNFQKYSTQKLIKIVNFHQIGYTQLIFISNNNEYVAKLSPRTQSTQNTLTMHTGRQNIFRLLQYLLDVDIFILRPSR